MRRLCVYTVTFDNVKELDVDSGDDPYMDVFLPRVVTP